MSTCTFITNVYEKTYRSILAPGQLTAMIQPHAYPFAERIVTINNVADRSEVSHFAELTLKRGEIDRYVFVEDELDGALKKASMHRKQLGRLPYYTTCDIVALAITQTPYLVYQDAGVALISQANDWIARGIQMLEKNDAIFVINPSYEHTQNVSKDEALTYFGDYIVSYGFSDLLFLVRTSLLTEPFHHTRHWASLRFPLAAITPVFEQWMDSYSRTYHKLRLTDRRVVLSHDGVFGGSQNTPHTLLERAKRKLNTLLSPLGLRRSQQEGRHLVHQLLDASRS